MPPPPPPPAGRGPGIVAWARRNPALAAGGAAGAGLIGFILYKRNQANAPADTADTGAAAGSIGPPAAFGDAGGGGDPYAEFGQQLASLQGQLSAITTATNPTQPQKAFSFYQLAREILQRSGIANPSKKQIDRERAKLLRTLGPAPRSPVKPQPNPHRPAPRRFPGGRIVVGKRR
jgi:hypothetical protein